MECVLICNPRVLFSLGCVVSRIVKGPCLVDDYMTDGISLHIKSNITTNKNTDATLLRNTCLLVKSSSIMYDLDGAALSGCLLASLLNEAVSPYAGPEQRTGTRYAEGLLFGTVIRRQGTETGDAHEQRTTTHREAVLTGYVRSSERYAFYDALGNVEDARLAPLIPEGEFRQRLAGYFIARKGTSTRPSLRELEVFRSLAASPLCRGQPPVLLLACLRLKEGSSTQSFQYQCLTVQGGSENGKRAGRVELLPCRINNVTMDSSTEYGKLRPAALDPLGVGNAQTSALVQAFGPVPPPHVHEAEAVFDRGVETMESLVAELKAVENDVHRLQVENRCMERVMNRPKGI